MGITFWPQPGTVLMCDFNSNLEPEIVKVRRVVVVSSVGVRQVMVVVPISTTPSREIRPVHVKLTGRYEFLARDVWAKCELVTHVARYRLDRVRYGERYLNGWQTRITHDDLTAIRFGVLHAIGLGFLVPPPSRY